MTLLHTVVFAAVAAAGVATAQAAPAWCAGAVLTDELDIRDLSSRDPEVVVADASMIDAAEKAHAQANAWCFIANSVRSEIVVHAVPSAAD